MRKSGAGALGYAMPVLRCAGRWNAIPVGRPFRVLPGNARILAGRQRRQAACIQCIACAAHFLTIMHVKHVCLCVPLLPPAPPFVCPGRSYVEQFDVHTPQATVEEALMFSARMRLPPDLQTPGLMRAYVHEVGTRGGMGRARKGNMPTCSVCASPACHCAM